MLCMSHSDELALQENENINVLQPDLKLSERLYGSVLF